MNMNLCRQLSSVLKLTQLIKEWMLFFVAYYIVMAPAYAGGEIKYSCKNAAVFDTRWINNFLIYDNTNTNINNITASEPDTLGNATKILKIMPIAASSGNAVFVNCPSFDIPEQDIYDATYCEIKILKKSADGYFRPQMTIPFSGCSKEDVIKNNTKPDCPIWDSPWLSEDAMQSVANGLRNRKTDIYKHINQSSPMKEAKGYFLETQYHDHWFNNIHWYQIMRKNCWDFQDMNRPLFNTCQEVFARLKAQHHGSYYVPLKTEDMNFVCAVTPDQKIPICSIF